MNGNLKKLLYKNYSHWIQVDYIDDYIFDGEFVLLAEDGGTYGKFENTAYIIRGKFWVNNHAHILRAIEGRATNPFILFILNFLDLNPYIVGSTRKKLNQEQMREIKIPLPSLPEQQNIAKILSTVDEAIQKVDEAIARSERLKLGLMRELLTKGIGHKEFKDTEIGRIPKEWALIKLCDITFDFIGGGTPSTSQPEYWNGDIPWMTSANLSSRVIWTGMRNITKKGLENSATNIVPKGSLLISTRVGIGKVGISGIDIAVSQDLTGLVLDKSRVDIEYIYWFILNHSSHLACLSQGSTVKGLTRDYVKNLKVLLPPLSEQQKIAEILSTVDGRLELLRKRKEKLERIKRGLMNDLLTRRKRVRLEAGDEIH